MSATIGGSVAAQVGLAIRTEKLEILSQLIRENPEQLHVKTPLGGQTWLGYAMRLGSVEVVHHLLTLGFDVNEGDPQDNIKPLCEAGYKGSQEKARLLLDAGSTMDTATSVQNPCLPPSWAARRMS